VAIRSHADSGMLQGVYNLMIAAGVVQQKVQGMLPSAAQGGTDGRAGEPVRDERLMRVRGMAMCRFADRLMRFAKRRAVMLQQCAPNDVVTA